MTGRCGHAALALAVAVWLTAIGLRAQAPELRVPAEAAALVTDGAGRSQLEARASVLDTPVLPGSIAKVFALAAAVEAGVVRETDTHVCRRVATADGRRFVCSHPDLKRPLTPAEALAYSCNDYFVRLSARLPRFALNYIRRRAGLEPIADTVPWASAVVGLAGPRTTPRALRAAVARTIGAGAPPMPLTPAARAVVRAGMRGAVEYGSASAWGAPAGALAKTGTAPMPGGRSLGLAVVFAAADPTASSAMVVAPGGAGIDAAELAGRLLFPPPRVTSAAPAPEPATPAAAAPVRVAPGPAVATAPAPAPPAVRPLPASPPRTPPPAVAAPPSPRVAAVPESRSTAGSDPGAVPARVSDADLRAASGGQTIRIGVTNADGVVHARTLAIEEYVARVISGEGEPRAGRAAHDALAIVIRTFAAANRHRHRAEGFDLCDTTHCQVMRPSIPVARQAALATAGRLLLDGGQPAFVYYSALCGGIPALASEVWPGASDYRPEAARDDACEDQPAWSSQLRADQLERALRAAGLHGQRLRGLRVVDRTTSRRAGTLHAEGFSPAEISAHELRMAVGRTLGWQWLRSTAFEVTRTAAGYRFRGVGFGHGVGLCVIGAGRRAARGESAAQILRAYFGDLAISDGPPAETPAVVEAAPPRPVPPAAPVAPGGDPDIKLALPAAEERERAAITGLLRRVRADIAARAGVGEPRGLTITVHPTIESFGRATGQPWWVAGATVGRVIDLLPIGTLRQRGILESTLRHEVAHVVVDAALASRPVWVREGVAMLFAAGDTPAAVDGGRVRCPADVELLRPITAGAHRVAYSRAERCVRRAIAGGARWTEIR
ncbi:MAG: SpoIID/LytB domain-containing protein [Vicinamibacterales bacterium]